MKTTRAKLIPMPNEDGQETNDYRGNLPPAVLELPEVKAKHLADIGRASAVKESKKK